MTTVILHTFQNCADFFEFIFVHAGTIVLHNNYQFAGNCSGCNGNMDLLNAFKAVLYAVADYSLNNQFRNLAAAGCCWDIY